MSLTDQARELLSKFEVLKDLESTVREMMATHERKRVLWMPSDLLGLAEGDCSETHLRNLRARAQGIPDAVRAALRQSWYRHILFEHAVSMQAGGGGNRDLAPRELEGLAKAPVNHH